MLPPNLSLAHCRTALFAGLFREEEIYTPPLTRTNRAGCDKFEYILLQTADDDFTNSPGLLVKGKLLTFSGEELV